MILDYASGGSFNDWMNNNYKKCDWNEKLLLLADICEGLEGIHQKQMVHRDFHTGNILFKFQDERDIFISDMGLCGEVDNIDKAKIYGIMPYIAPEVLKGNPYTDAADIYSFGMIMYFVATGKQPFANRAHDYYLAMDIFKGIRPEINVPEAPECYIDLMKRCWSSNQDNRPKIAEIRELINVFENSYSQGYEMLKQKHYKIEKQFKAAEEYRRMHFSSIENIVESSSHPQAIYTSRLINPLIKDSSKYEYVEEPSNYFNISKDIDFDKLANAFEELNNQNYQDEDNHLED
ncbi:kinase-like domain-containing protein [Glomus cerebriforme]|uniref:Kinase-like domain-containing protein n=1 Tax=Glomus cerebriforme TaxID=658196 RepID=A0A397T4U3_9GLOM|nr:kinase-like domain-containing protein [Glomus cerebriforme]